MLKTCWEREDESFHVQSIFVESKLGQCHLTNVMRNIPRGIGEAKPFVSHLIPILQFVLRQIEFFHRVAFVFQVFGRSGLINSAVVQHEHLRYAVRAWKLCNETTTKNCY